ncbi:hypothetical protein DY000_02044226 [Brassica cretica]|uniref:Uncharacterized protein n=1 Tax=Brassica cretica TaxID=69181 RepID=A0ABQ7ETR5_BRACR|nr:hypothetical protein DY000_02044226 [Brassica cretica]
MLLCAITTIHLSHHRPPVCAAVKPLVTVERRPISREPAVSPESRAVSIHSYPEKEPIMDLMVDLFAKSLKLRCLTKHISSRSIPDIAKPTMDVSAGDSTLGVVFAAAQRSRPVVPRRGGR